MQSTTLYLCLAAALTNAACGSKPAVTTDPISGITTTVANGEPASTRRNAITVILPEGTPLTIRTTSTLSTKTQETGQTFTGSLDQSLLQDGQEIASKGARVEGKITDADDGGRVKGVASIGVQLTGLEVGDEFIHLSTSTLTRSAKTTKTNDAVKIGIGAGIGAAIGAIAGGGKGAAIGAGAGGAAGTGVVLATHGSAAEIPSESLLTFKLRAPVTISAK
jgi:hypothetical protein